MDQFIYPVNDYGPIMPGILMGGVAIVHVFLAQFAVGGGILLCYFHWLAMTGRNPHARLFVQGYFRWLVLISFVLGALTGVGIWFTAIQVSAPTIGEMVRNFHWIWAAEWTFFCLEIFAGYMFYRYHKVLDDGTNMKLLILYAGAAWASLFLINGIISWQLTPGVWVETRDVWDGIFNPTFWPSLFFRTIVACTLAALVACVVINTMTPLSRKARHTLIGRATHLLVPMLAMPFLGVWFLWAMPDDSRAWILGGSPAMTLFMNIAVVASLAIGGYAIVGLFFQKLYINGATASLLVLLAFGATAGGEFVREGSRKPYSVRALMFSNGILPSEVARLREVGCLEDDPYPLRGADQMPSDQVRTGAKVYRRQCAVCHTVSGINGLTELTGHWSNDQMRMNIAKLQQTKAFMPPFAGTAEELEALVQFLNWADGQPVDESEQEAALVRIQQWMDEAGTESILFQTGK